MAQPNSPRERLLFNDDWRFHRGDAPDGGAALDYDALKPWILATGCELISAGLPKPQRPPGHPGEQVSFVRPDFDDSGFRQLALPHDFGVEGEFSQELPGETGKLPWQGVAWYRKRFTIPKDDAGRQLELELEGAMAYSTIWLNGKLLGGWPYGYTTFRVDLTPHLLFGAENVLAIRLNNPPESSRWYPGSGIYRDVWLLKRHRTSIEPWGVFVSTPKISDAEALVNLDIAVQTFEESRSDLTLDSQIFELDRAGTRSAKPVASSSTTKFDLDPPRAYQTLRSQVATIQRPKRWDLDSPQRYLAVTTLRRAEEVLDVVETPFGVRTAGFVANDGFHLNGRRVPLQGVCMHHDQGAIGSAVHRRALERQLRILREMGTNAIRTSHNPPAPELLELCDQMGFLVMDEAFDCWRRGKKTPQGAPEKADSGVYFDYARVFDDWYERDLRALIRRDRNHPCVVIWSIGNEVIEQWYSDGWQLGQRLAGIVREEDRTRPITSALNGDIAAYRGFQTVLDAIGFNYKPHAYAELKAHTPQHEVYGAETSSTVSTRGEYFFPVEPDNKLHGRVNFQVSSYDLSTANWAHPPDVEFRGLDQSPYAAGEFVWTGFDYLGEPTPYNSDSTNLLNFSDEKGREQQARELERLGKIKVPSRSSYFGIIDLAGFPKDRFYIYQARWRPELKMAHILPHWDFPERVGQITPVQVYTAADEAELFLNGRSLGKKRRGPLEYRFRWDDVRYEPGELRVQTYKQGKPWAEATRRTTGGAALLLIEADRTKLVANGRDLSFLTIRVSDAAGLTDPNAAHRIRVTIEGPGDLLAMDNGDPTDLTPFFAPERAAFHGLLLAIVRTRRGETGRVVVRAGSAGLQGAEHALEVC
ncbi:MAG TPA: beta-galactosidase GalB [Polyangiaceae bacterium]|jgi:beta-galactosidase